jgi:nickel-dependent lactate racemase
MDEALMQVELLYHTKKIKIELPDDTRVFQTTYPEPVAEPWAVVEKALNSPVDSQPLEHLLKNRRAGDVVIVVSDISRPIPYPVFLPQFIDRLVAAGVQKNEILILIATGMHRPSTPEERIEILGENIVNAYCIEDHLPDANDLIVLPGTSWSGNMVRLNKRVVEAGFRIITGLVEPHFMAGFSGGRKAVCPGLASLETVQRFHGYDILSNENAANGILNNNPCHLEALSVAQTLGVDFSLNVVLNHERDIIYASAGELDAAHLSACEFVQQHACPAVDQEYDVILTNSAGYPLDTTFYQCVKGLVSALPAVKPGGHIISIGGCAEGIGSDSYKNIMLKYSGDFKQFLKDIQESDTVIKDQWQYQMHARVLEKIGQQHIHFFTENIPPELLHQLSVNGVSTPDVQSAVQSMVDDFVRQGKSICVCPEGPYCAPVTR